MYAARTPPSPRPIAATRLGSTSETPSAFLKPHNCIQVADGLDTEASTGFLNLQSATTRTSYGYAHRNLRRGTYHIQRHHILADCNAVPRHASRTQRACQCVLMLSRKRLILRHLCLLLAQVAKRGCRSRLQTKTMVSILRPVLALLGRGGETPRRTGAPNGPPIILLIKGTLESLI